HEQPIAVAGGAGQLAGGAPRVAAAVARAGRSRAHGLVRAPGRLRLVPRSGWLRSTLRVRERGRVRGPGAGRLARAARPRRLVGAALARRLARGHDRARALLPPAPPGGELVLEARVFRRAGLQRRDAPGKVLAVVQQMELDLHVVSGY